MTEKNVCRCCGRHCDLDTPHCERGKEYARTGVVIQKGCDLDTVEKKGPDVDYDALDVDQRLILNLRDLGHKIRFLFEGKGSQKRILIILQEMGDMTQRELTERLGIQPGSVSEVIGKLEHAGLLSRSPSSTDRRTMDLQLTEAGRVQAEAMAEQRRMRHQEMFSCLSEEEKETLVGLAEKLSADWNSRYHETVPEHSSMKCPGQDRERRGKQKRGRNHRFNEYSEEREYRGHRGSGEEKVHRRQYAHGEESGHHRHDEA